MRQLAADAGAVETVMFRDGYLTEASASNVLVVIDGTIVAPPKDELILPGITYGAAWEFAREAGIPFEIRPVPQAEALAADEMWLTSSTKEVLAVTTLDGQPFAGGKPGPLFRKMHALFQAHKPAIDPARAHIRRDAWSRTGRDGTRGRAPLLRPQVIDFADEQHVIARPVPRVVPALEPRDAAVDQRRARRAQPVIDAREAIGVRTREPAREIGLVVREHVDRVVLGASRTRRGSSPGGSSSTGRAAGRATPS